MHHHVGAMCSFVPRIPSANSTRFPIPRPPPPAPPADRNPTCQRRVPSSQRRERYSTGMTIKTRPFLTTREEKRKEKKRGLCYAEKPSTVLCEIRNRTGNRHGFKNLIRVERRAADTLRNEKLVIFD